MIIRRAFEQALPEEFNPRADRYFDALVNLGVPKRCALNLTREIYATRFCLNGGYEIYADIAKHAYYCKSLLDFRKMWLTVLIKRRKEASEKRRKSKLRLAAIQKLSLEEREALGL